MVQLEGRVQEKDSKSLCPKVRIQNSIILKKVWLRREEQGEIE